MNNYTYIDKVLSLIIQEESVPNGVLTGAPLSADGSLIPGGMANVVFAITGVETQKQEKVIYTWKQSKEQAEASFLVKPFIGNNNAEEQLVTLGGCGLTIDPQNGSGMADGCCG